MGLFNRKHKTKEEVEIEWEPLFKQLLSIREEPLIRREAILKANEEALRLAMRDFEEHKNTVLLEQINKHGWEVKIVGKESAPTYQWNY